jgi:signal transduction histidine kinase
MARLGAEFGLRRTVTLATLVLGAFAVTVSIALIVLTTSLGATSATLRGNVRQVRLARQAQVDLLLHKQATAPDVRDALDRKLREALRDTDGVQTISPPTRALRDAARRHIERYLDISRESDQQAAFEAAIRTARRGLEDFVLASIEDADRANQDAARLDRMGNVIGGTAIVGMTLVSSLLILWMRRSVARPILQLSDAMDRFGKGDLAVRAMPSGASELRRMTSQFNSMGEALMLNHKARLAHLAGIAHDLRNPLAALQMSTALASAARTPLEANVDGAFAIVRRQVSRLTRMVNDLLDATRIEAGELALVLKEGDLRSVIVETLALFENASPIHTLSIELPADPMIVKCDHQRIEQVLNNLVSNAIKYSPRGGAISIAARIGEGRLQISVKDNGIGIAEADLEHIWAPFARTGASTESIPGVGLGLWTSKKLIDAHGGELCVSSVLGSGSTFTLTLPLVVAPPTAEPLDMRSPVPSHG